MQYRHPHPWDGQYALPENVMAEPPRFGTLTTKYRPRRSIDAPAIAPPWKTGYAYPSYLEEEPIGGGVFYTKYTPRKTISTLIPNYLGADLALGDAVEDLETTPELNIRGGQAWLEAAEARYSTSLDGVGQPINFDSGQAWIEAASRRYGYPLGADDLARAANHTDAVGKFGKKAANVIFQSIRGLPAHERALALRTAVDRLEPGLWRRVVFKAKEFSARGQSANAALKHALASQMSAGIVAELVRTGQRGSVAPQSMLGACCGMHPLGAVETVVAARRGRRTTGEQPKDPYGKGTDADPWRFPPGMVDGTVRDHRIINVPAIKRAYNSAVVRYAKIAFAGAQLSAAVKQGKIPFVTFTVAKTQSLPFGRGTLQARQKMGVYYDEGRGTMSVKKIPRRKTGLLSKVGSALKGIGKAIIALPKAIGEAVVAVVEAAGGIIDKIGGLACDLVSSEAGQLAAEVGARSQGAPPQAGSTGAEIAAGICQGGPGAPPYVAPPASKFPILPVAIGGAALLAWYFMSKRKK